MTLSVDGREPGDTVELSGPGTVSIHAAVRSIFPLRSLEVVRNGEVVVRADANGGRQAEISEELRIDGNSWIACRAFGVAYHLDERVAGFSRTLRRSTLPALATGRLERPFAEALRTLEERRHE